MKPQAQTLNLDIEVAVNQASDGIFIIDQERRLVYFSDGCERITGTNRSFVLGTSCACYQLTNCKDEHGRSLSGVLCPALKVMEGEIPSYSQRMSIDHQDGTRIWVETNYSAIRTDGGLVTGVVGVMRDVSGRSEHLDGFETGTDGQIGVADNDSQAENVVDPSAGKLDRILGSLERREILQALKDSNGQRTLAARALGISRSRLYRRMDALGIDVHK